MATTAKRVKDALKTGKRCPTCRGKDSKDCVQCKGKTKIFTTRRHNRCQLCGRPRAFLRKFGVCRLCFRGLALRGEVPGVSKSSW